MTVQELRIGNLVLDDSSDKIMVVSRIESKQFTQWNSGGSYNIVCLGLGTKKEYREGDFNPIPITEERLVRFGFIIIENNWKVLDLHFCKINWERLAGLTITFESESIFMPHIKYVHQLQNLYFALTGEELSFEQ